MNTVSTPKQNKVQVADRDALCKALAEEMCRPDTVDYSVYYTSIGDPDAASAPSVQKHNAKLISMSIVKRVALKCPTYQWIRKTAQVTPHTIRNGFICALAEEHLQAPGPQPKSCNGSLSVTLIRRVPGQVTVKARLKHDFGHNHVAVSVPASTLGQRALTQSTLAPVVSINKDPLPPPPPRAFSGATTTAASITHKLERGESIAKDILRALGRRPRTPEPFKQGTGRPRKEVDENTPATQAETVKRGRGRPRKEVDPNAPVVVKTKNPVGRPLKESGPPLAVNKTVPNQSINGGTYISSKFDAKTSNGAPICRHDVSTTVQM